jgi:hypothetical protein
MGPLAGVLQMLGGGGGVVVASSGAATKLVAAGCCAVLLAGGAGVWVAGRRGVVRHRSPGVEAGGKTLIGKPIRPGTKLPPNVAMSTVTVALPAGAQRIVKRSVRVTCPAGMGAAGLAQPRRRDGSVAVRGLRMYRYSNADIDALAHGGRHTAVIQYAAVKNLPAPLVVRVGTLCKQRTG